MRILTIDGGGVRGLIPALVLAEVEARTGRPTAELFDLVAGTSTGGVLACGLAAPDPARPGRPRWSAAELAAAYEADAPRIFRRSLLRRLGTLDGAIDERYAPDGLREVLAERLGDARLSDVPDGVDLLLPTYDLERRAPLLLRSARARTAARPGAGGRADGAGGPLAAVGADEDLPLVDAALGTSAAPTYFPPVRLRFAGGRTAAVIDGGVYANNPSLVALADVLREDGGRRPGGAGAPPRTPVALAEAGIDRLVALGTGTHGEPIAEADAAGWGQLGWARRIVDVVFDGIADTTDFALDRLLGERHVRLQARLHEGADALDDASPANLRALRGDAERLVAREGRRIDALCARLLEPDRDAS